MRNTCEKQAGKPIKWKNMQAKIHKKMQILFRFFLFRRFLFALFPLYFFTFFPICLEENCENAKHIKNNNAKNTPKTCDKKMNSRNKTNNFREIWLTFIYFIFLCLFIFLLVFRIFVACSMLFDLVFISLAFVFTLKNNMDLAGSGELNTNLELSFDPCIERVMTFQFQAVVTDWDAHLRPMDTGPTWDHCWTLPAILWLNRRSGTWRLVAKPNRLTESTHQGFTFQESHWTQCFSRDLGRVY